MSALEPRFAVDAKTLIVEQLRRDNKARRRAAVFVAVLALAIGLAPLLMGGAEMTIDAKGTALVAVPVVIAAAALAFGQPLVTRTRLVAAAFVLGGMLVAVALAVGEPWYPGVGLHTICLGIGTAVGAALFALMFPARRLVRKSLGAFWLLGVLAAAAGMILLALICKDNRLLHLLTTHVGAIVPTFAIAVLLFRPREKRSAIVEIPER